MYYNDVQRNYYEPPMYNDAQRVNNFGCPPLNQAQYNHYVTPGYNNAQADFYGFGKTDYNTYSDNYYKANNQW